jgi:imidazolonepropionase
MIVLLNHLIVTTMASLLFRNIKSLVGIRDKSEIKVSGSAMRILPMIDNAFLLVENGLIKSFGEDKDAPEHAEEIIDATGKFLLPTWCDSHSHIVYAGNRESEFVDKINGLSYEEIAAKGGGILNSAATLSNTSEQELFEQATKRLEEVRSLGTGAIEIKSGYGLSKVAEMKMLRVIRRLKETSSVTIKSTFLGAHAIPLAYKQNPDAYVNELISWLPEIAGEELADFIDVFCETNYFTVAHLEQILEVGVKFGLQGKVHVNQFSSLGGIAAAVKHKARSVDHLEVMSEGDIQHLVNSEVMPTALPGCSLFLGIPYTPGRAIIDVGLPLALATDFNPGSCPSGNMNLVVSLACMKIKLLPEEAINAATINGAYAMNLSNELGSITVGKKANLMLTKPVNSLASLPYYFGKQMIERVFI